MMMQPSPDLPLPRINFYEDAIIDLPFPDLEKEKPIEVREYRIALTPTFIKLTIDATITKEDENLGIWKEEEVDELSYIKKEFITEMALFNTESGKYKITISSVSDSASFNFYFDKRRKAKEVLENLIIWWLYDN